MISPSSSTAASSASPDRKTFASLGLGAALARAAADSGYGEPTPVQAEAIPAVLAGRDLRASARTGSGKTAAFALPLLQHTLASRRQQPLLVQALVIVPTRELATQVGEAFRAFARNLRESVKVAVLHGGVSINPQMMGLRGGADVVVATPGRLLDLLDHNALHLRDVAVLVLDEADRLLDLGFAEEMARVLALLPARRQTLLFSATFPPAVRALADRLLGDPVRIEVAQGDAGEPDIVQRALRVDTASRTALLAHLLRRHGWTRTLVFVATRYASEHVAHKLRKHGIKAAALHGDLSQGARTKALDDFKAGRLEVLTSTDVAARGIDIALLPVVVNYDLPRSAVDYVHRIGRTGRAGAAGVAVSFISADAEAHFRLIENRQKQRVPREVEPGFEPVEVADAAAEAESASQADGGVKGRRKSKKDKIREAAAAASTSGPTDRRES